MTHATSKGGKTLLVPTPYVIKMALLDACFRQFGVGYAMTMAQRVFDTIKGRPIHFNPPEHCVVENTFLKILDHARKEKAAGGEEAADAGDSPAVQGPFKQTIAYREFVFLSGPLTVALGATGLDSDTLQLLANLFAHINSFGKRGGFWQFRSHELLHGELPAEFTVPRPQATPQQILTHGVTQALDDFGPALVAAKDGFDRVSTYGGGTIKLGEHRVLTLTALPYRRQLAGRAFTWYTKTAG
jgi:hypothetical protein